jgi:antitoxin VapB
MTIFSSKTFKSGNSEAVRLPKELAFGEGVEVEILQTSEGITIRRKSRFSGKDLVDALNALPKPSKPMKREPIEFPERPGL